MEDRPRRGAFPFEVVVLFGLNLSIFSMYVIVSVIVVLKIFHANNPIIWTDLATLHSIPTGTKGANSGGQAPGLQLVLHMGTREHQEVVLVGPRAAREIRGELE